MDKGKGGKWPGSLLANSAAAARIVYISACPGLLYFGSLMFPESTREDLAAGLDAVAMDLLERAGVETPPVNAFHLARQLGIAVARDDLQQGRARYVRLARPRTGVEARNPSHRGRRLRRRSRGGLRPPAAGRENWTVASRVVNMAGLLPLGGVCKRGQNEKCQFHQPRREF